MNLNEQFEKDVELLINRKDVPDLATRIEEVERITEWYFSQTGSHYKKNYHLDLLGNYLLTDILRDKNIYKVKHDDYPVLSHRQEKLRNRRESRVGDEHLDYIKLVEVHNHTIKKSTENKEDN